ncbi:MAG: lactate utilization protein [Coprococcus sp.]|nr:lactate utilization protein [Coprococcus sp.]
MDKFRNMRNDMLAERVIKGLASRNMEGFYVHTKEEAKELALSLMPEGSSVGWGGSMTAKDIGLIDAVIEGNYKEINRDTAKTPEEKNKLSREMFFADYFITGCNAMTEDGVMVNIDGNGNRVAAIVFGPSHVIVICGMNKIVRDEAAAFSRARNEAAPVNAQRFGLETPCSKTGVCADCKSPDTICCQFLTTRYSKHKGRIKVILVNEDLGF